MKSLIINIVVDDNIHIEINNMSREDANEQEAKLAYIIEMALSNILKAVPNSKTEVIK